jgi:hypothetical protein
MRAITKFATAAAAALTIAAVASPAGAVITTFGQQETTGTTHSVKFVQDADLVGGNFFSITSNADVSTQTPGVLFDFLFPELQALGLENLAADFTLSARTEVAANCIGGFCNQGGLDGSFTYIYTGSDSFTVHGHNVTTGANLLSGSFTGAHISGVASSGSLSASTFAGHVIAANSDVVTFGPPFDYDFSFTLSSARRYPSGTQPGIGAAPGQSLATFTASSNALFSADSVGIVPEASTWALMILGFGSAGAMLRSRRRAAAQVA